MKKRGLAGLLALALILALAACGGTEAQEDAAQDQKMEEAAPPQEEETSETDGEDGVPVTIEGPETADDSQQLQEDEPDLGSRPADPAKEPETGSRPADPAEKQVYQPVEDTNPCPSSGVCFRRGSGGFLRFRDRGPGDVARPDGRGG